MKRIQRRVDPNILKNHLLNIEIYGDKPDPEFVEMVRQNGVTEPIMVTQDYMIISGHRRNQAAKICKQKEVPIAIVDLADELEIEKLLIISNRQREKTNEIKLREYKRLKVIEQKQAAARKKATQKKGSTEVENLPPPGKQGKSRDLAAKEVGLSGKTAEVGTKVIHKIDELEEAGETEEANALRDTLNKSVSGAHKKVTGEKRAPKPFNEKNLDNDIGKVARGLDRRHEVHNGKKEHGECIKHLRALNNALKSWRAKG